MLPESIFLSPYYQSESLGNIVPVELHNVRRLDNTPSGMFLDITDLEAFLIIPQPRADMRP